jgi:hypothetical protein
MPLFKELPLELQQKIWEAVSFIPRNVDVWHKNIYTSREDGAGADYVHYRMISRTPPPAILHVCQESREVALKHYKLAFGATKDCGTFAVVSKPRIYINPLTDTVCLPRPYGFWDHSTGTDGDNHHIDNRARTLPNYSET